MFTPHMEKEGLLTISNTKFSQTVSRNLRILFQKPGSRADFAKQYFISPSVISKWTAMPPSPISLYDAALVADYFNIPLEWLITEHAPTRMPYYETVPENGRLLDMLL